jgi:hypothetical protein
MAAFTLSLLLTLIFVINVTNGQYFPSTPVYSVSNSRNRVSITKSPSDSINGREIIRTSPFSSSSTTSIPPLFTEAFRRIENVTDLILFSNRDDAETTTGLPEEKFFNPFKNKSANGIIGDVITAIVPDKLEGTLGSILTSAENCITNNEGYNDPDLGDFRTTKNSIYCSSNCTRNIICCSPQPVKELDVQFIYSNSKTSSKKIGLNDGLNSKKKIVWIVHGFLNDYTQDDNFNDTKDAYIDRGFDVVVVDWSKGNKLYLQSTANVRVVGALVGQMMHRMGVTDRSICAGFSLGAHVCGEAGKWIKRRTNNVIWKCHGIDPAGPGYDGCDSEVRLDPSDCTTVVSMHTSQYNTIVSLVGKSGLGTKYRTGHCDFWMNDAITQPKCNNASVLGVHKDIFAGKFGKIASDIERTFTCSHSRAMRYYINSVKQECEFKGVQSEGCGNANEGGCQRVKKSLRSSNDDRSRRNQRRRRGVSLSNQFGVSNGSSTNIPQYTNDRGNIRSYTTYNDEIFSVESSTQSYQPSRTTSSAPMRRKPNGVRQRPNDQDAPSNGNYNAPSGRLPVIMKLFPDDDCRPGVTIDYQVETSGDEPFCFTN